MDLTQAWYRVLPIQPQIRIVPARSPEDFKTARQLFLAYASQLVIDLTFQNFEEEVATLPGQYAPPQRELLLARGEEKGTGYFSDAFDGLSCLLTRNAKPLR